MTYKVAIEASSASSGGAISFLSQICPILAQTRKNTTFYLLSRSSQFSKLPALPNNFKWIKIPDQTDWVPFRLIWLQVALPRILTKIGANILLSASDVSTLRPPCPMVLMVHNINPFTPMREQIWGKKQIARMAVHRKLIKACAQKATKVVFVSEWSKRSILPALNIPETNTGVVYHGVNTLFKPLSSQSNLKSNRRFILAVSEVLEHKNFTRLAEAFIQLSRYLDEEIHLVIAGSISSEKLRRSLEERLDEEGILDRVTFLGSVPQEELADLYQRAALLVFPSLGETFGLPLIEAMASGLPVATSNSSAMPEICEDAACYFDPLDIEDMALTLRRILSDPSLQETLVQRGLKRSEEFSWSKTAASLLSFMKAASGNTESTE